MKLKGFELVPRTKPRDNYYNSYTWRKISREHLRLEPLCRICDEKGLTVVAKVVDHIQQRRDGGSDNHFNLRSLCFDCHQKVSGIQGYEAVYNKNPKWMK
jgi:5-methylcytosine-specific restriction protein A